jgi:hypothetical protein
MRWKIPAAVKDDDVESSFYTSSSPVVGEWNSNPLKSSSPTLKNYASIFAIIVVLIARSILAMGYNFYLAPAERRH